MAMSARSNGLPFQHELPLTFKRRSATDAANAAFAKLVGKTTDRAKHSPTEYVSADGRWVIRSVQHRGHGSTNSGRVRWHVAHDGRYFAVGFGSGSYACTLEDAIDEIHLKIGKGVCDGFRVLADMRYAAEKREREAAKRTADLARAKELLSRVCGADPSRLIEQIAAHVDLDALARAVNAASEVQS